MNDVAVWIFGIEREGTFGFGAGLIRAKPRPSRAPPGGTSRESQVMYAMMAFRGSEEGTMRTVINKEMAETERTCFA